MESVVIGKPFGYPEHEWDSGCSSSIPQDALNELAEKHSNQGIAALYRFIKENRAMLCEEFFSHRPNFLIPSTVMSQKISEITQKKVYCHRGFAKWLEQYGFRFPVMFYKLEEDLVNCFPYLKKYPNWENLFERVEDSNCYLLKEGLIEFLVNKSASHRLKESMK